MKHGNQEFFKKLEPFHLYIFLNHLVGAFIHYTL